MPIARDSNLRRARVNSCSLRRTEASSCCNCCCSSGNFQYSEDLPLLHVSSVVDVEFLDIAGNFCVYVDFLKWLKFRGDLQVVRDISPRHFHDGGDGSIRRIVSGRLAVPRHIQRESQNKSQEDTEPQDSVDTLHWRTSAISHHDLASVPWISFSWHSERIHFRRAVFPE